MDLVAKIKGNPRISHFYLEVSKEERDRRRIDRNRDEADNLKFFDLLEEKFGEYKGFSSIRPIDFYEVKASKIDVEEVVEFIEMRYAD